MDLWRPDDLAAVTHALDRSRDRQGGLLVLEALPGLGRSALLRAATDHARAVGLTTLTARGSASERGFEHGATLQLLEELVLTRGPKDQRNLFAGPAATARALFHPDARRTAVPTDGFRVVHGLLWVLTRLFEATPGAILVDDADLIDAPSLLFLTHLVDRLGDLGVTVVLSVSCPLERDPAVEALVHHPQAVVLHLEPIPIEPLAEAIAGEHPEVAPDRCRSIAELSGGIPLLADRLLIAAERLNDVPDREADAQLRDYLDPRIRDVLKRSIDCLEPSARRAAVAAAILEGDAFLHGVAHVAELDLDEALESAKQVLEAGLSTSLDPIELVSPTVSGALRALVPPKEAARLSRRGAEALARHGREVDRLAPLLVRAEPAGDPAVVSHLWSAARRGREAEDRSSAIAYLRRALAEPAPADVRPDLLLELGLIEAQVGDDLAVLHLEEAAALLRDRNHRARALLAAGRLRADLGRGRDAVTTLRRGLALQPDDEAVRRELEAQLIAVAQLDLDHWRQRPDRNPTTPVSDLPDSAADRLLLAHLALDHVIRGEALDAADRWARSLLPRLMVTGAAGEAEAVSAVAGALLWLGDPGAAEPLLDAALPATQQGGDLALEMNLTARRAMVRAAVGELHGAVADGSAALAAGIVRLRPGASSALATAHLLTGDLAAAAAALPSPVEGSGWQTPPMAALVALAVGDVSRARGEPHLAMQHYVVAGELAERAEIRNPLVVPHLERLALTHLELGDAAEARAAAEEAFAGASRSGLGVAVARASVVLARTVEKARAIPLLEEALPELEARRQRIAVALAKLELGDALLRSGHRHDGLRHLHDAEAIAAESGASTLLEQIRHLLRAAGARARRAERARSLTPSEARVVELARAGRTNREIATELYVTVKAVEWHLHNAYRKLGVSDRRELRALPDPS